MARHQVFVVAAPITETEEVLKNLRDRLRQLPIDVFKTLPMVHFASFVVLERTTLAGPPLLVMECNIDGSADDFFRALLEKHRFQVDGIFGCCVDYSAAEADADKLRYWHRYKRQPQLFHVGAPWRSVSAIQEDRSLRKRFDTDLKAAIGGSMMADIAVPPAGQREYWAWERFEPWAAWLLGIGGSAAAWWLYVMTGQSPSIPGWLKVALTAIYAALGLKALLGGVALWTDALPEVRARVRPWLWWLAFVAAAAWVGWLLHERAPRTAIGLPAAVAVAFLINAGAAIGRYANERLAAVRVNADGTPISDIWSRLSNPRVVYRSETDWAQRFQAWAWWFVVYFSIALMIWLAHKYASRAGVILFIGTLFFGKAVWLAVLAGWPAEKATGPDRARIILFVILAPIGAMAVSSLLMVLTWPPWVPTWLQLGLFTLLVIIAIFSLWSMPLPSPTPEHVPRRGSQLEEVAGQEDYGVQNHMTAVVVLRTDHRFRVPALRAFLLLLNKLFYRCFAPDLYRGKLFGIPTVHFAQWVLLDSRNYLFFSNYDNSWTTYLDDFGEVLAAGLQKVWGQGAGNPGIKDLSRFKEYARTTMVPHAFWYSAYPGLTVRQVWNNRELRRAVSRATGEEAMVSAVRRLAMAPRALPDVYHGRVR